MAVGLVVGAGCDESSSSGSNEGIELADQPQSMLGRSAASARELADQARNRDAQASGLADRLAGSDSVEVGGLKFQIPEGWESVAPSNNMRAAELHVKDAVAAFSMAGGSVDANIDRWAGQFVGGAEPKVEEREINGISVTLVELSGTYLDGGMFGPKTERPDYTMLAAIIPGAQTSVFIKMTGPSATIDDVYDQWLELVESVHR